MNEAEGRGITIIAQKWLNEILTSGKFSGENPFHYESKQLRLKFDSIRISNLSKMDGKGVQVGYYWKGHKMCIFTVMDVTLDTTVPDRSIDLTGVSGSMKMVVTD